MAGCQPLRNGGLQTGGTRANPEFCATLAKPFEPEALVREVLRALRVQRL